MSKPGVSKSPGSVSVVIDIYTTKSSMTAYNLLIAFLKYHYWRYMGIMSYFLPIRSQCPILPPVHRATPISFVAAVVNENKKGTVAS